MATKIMNGTMRETILGASPSKDDILQQIETEQIEFINLQFTDVMGSVKSVTVPSKIFGHIIDGGQWIARHALRTLRKRSGGARSTSHA